MDGRAARTVPLQLWACVCIVAGAWGLRRLWEALAHPCSSRACSPPALSPAAAAELEGAGFSLVQYAWASVGTTFLLMAAVVALAWAVSRHGGAPQAAPATLLAVSAAMANPPGLGSSVSGVLGRICITGTLLGVLWLVAAFPRPRPTQRWMWIPVALGGLWALATLWLPPLRLSIAAQEAPWVPLEGLVFAAVFATLAFGRLANYRAEDAAAKRQIRMVLASVLLLCLVGLAGSLSTTSFDGAAAGSLGGAAWFHVGAAAMVLVVGAMAASFISHNAWGAPIMLSAATAGAIKAGLLALAGAVTASVFLVLMAGRVPWLVAAFAATFAVLVPVPAARHWLNQALPGGPGDGLARSLSEVLAAASQPTGVIPAMEGLLAAHLRFPAARIVAASAPVAVPEGSAAVDVTDPDSGSPIAQVLLTLRQGRRHLSRAEVRAVQSAAAPIASGLALMRLTRDLHESREELRSVREIERKTLRHTLHDDVVPLLAIARHRISAARSSESGGKDHLGWAEASIDAAVDQLRLMARALLPTPVSTHGLREAVEHFAVGLSTPVELFLQLDRALPQDVELDAYQVIVEALINAERHSGAGMVTVRIHAMDGKLELSVYDNGGGIQPGHREGLGLANMRETVAKRGGKLEVVPRMPQGTALRATLPFNERNVPWASGS